MGREWGVETNRFYFLYFKEKLRYAYLRLWCQQYIKASRKKPQAKSRIELKTSSSDAYFWVIPFECDVAHDKLSAARMNDKAISSSSILTSCSDCRVPLRSALHRNKQATQWQKNYMQFHLKQV